MRHRRSFRRLAVITLVALLLTSLSSASTRAITGATVLPAHVPGELILKLRQGFSADGAGAGLAVEGAPGLASLAGQYGVLAVEPLFPDAVASPVGFERVYRLTLPADADLLAAIEAFTAEPSVEYAEPNYIFQLDQGGTAADQGGAQSPEFDQLLREAQDQGVVRVIVGVQLPPAPAGWADDPQLEARRKAEIDQAQQSLLNQLSGVAVVELRRYSFIPHLALLVDAAALQLLGSLPEVASIEPDNLLDIQLDDSVPLIGGNVAAEQGFTGEGWTVAVLDTGVDKAHPFLAGKVVAEGCFSSQTTLGGRIYQSLCPGSTANEPIIRSTAPGSGVPCASNLRGCDHGTHVAGIAAGKAYPNMPGGPFGGVAPEANLIAVQVFSRGTNEAACGEGKTSCVSAFNSDIIAGLNYVFDLRTAHNIAAVNMSLGMQKPVHSDPTGCDFEPGDEDRAAMKAAIDELRATGIASVISSGNGDENNIGYKSGISFPACISSAISVGATTKDDKVAAYSNSSRHLKLLAPGSAISSAVPGGAFAEKDGTSMAAPHVAGAWAVLKQKAPLASVDQILSALTSTGRPVRDDRSGGDQLARPRINLAAALRVVPGGLTISNGPLYNFGAVRPNVVVDKAFTVRNSGRFDAVITPDPNLPAGAFSFKGGPYPGEGGTCGDVLLVGTSCTVVVSFSPEERTPATSALRFSYGAPLMNAGRYEVAITLAGTGTNGPRTPNDPLFNLQYGLHNTGQDGGRRDADIDAPEGWGIGSGAEDVLVAVIDSGVFYSHQDLDDGRVRTDIDWDYVNNDDTALDDNGHGTHVAGIIAAETNNRLGTAGVMWRAQILPLKVCDRRGSCNSDSIARAIRYAADRGARVINMSLGGSCASVIADAVNYAHFSRNVVVVAASGNDGGSVSFPAAHDPVIAVGAIDKRDALASFSNRGPDQDLVAPGRDIWSTVPRNGYDSFSGTSMAAPFVAGVAGALIAQRPDLTNEQVRAILLRSADDLGDTGRDDRFGYGRVNLYKALQQPTPDNPPPSPRAEECPVCGASAAAAEGSDGASLLRNIRALRDTVFREDPGRRWARIYYEHQVEVALMVATNGSMRAEVLAGWREFDPVFRRLMDESAPPVILTPELIATAERVMMGVAAQGSPAVHDVILAEWRRVDPDRFAGWEVREVWAQLVAENRLEHRLYLPELSVGEE